MQTLNFQSFVLIIINQHINESRIEPLYLTHFHSAPYTDTDIKNEIYQYLKENHIEGDINKIVPLSKDEYYKMLEKQLIDFANSAVC